MYVKKIQEDILDLSNANIWVLGIDVDIFCILLFPNFYNTHYTDVIINDIFKKQGIENNLNVH